MFIIKKNYYFYIDNTKSIDLNLIKRNSKIIIIYRNNLINESTKQLLKFRKKCKRLKINFFVANDLKLTKKIQADGLYISSYNKKIFKNVNVIGSAHNSKEIIQKIRQGCNTIIFSRLFKTNYKKKNTFYGIVRFNLIAQKHKINLIPLGGITNLNLLRLNLVKSFGLASLSAIKKKPAISSRLF